MSWIQMAFHTTADQAEQLSVLLAEAGAVSVSLQDSADEPLYEPAPGEAPLWRQTCVKGLFDADTDLGTVLAAVDAGCPGPLPLPAIEHVEDRVWERTWMDGFQPMRFGDRLWVCPTWRSPPDPAGVIVRLDPGLAFGTGTHPTTGLCLEKLDAMALEGTVVADYGCGSGLLGIAAALLGAERVWAVDIDPQALTAARTNARRNAVVERVNVTDPEHLPELETDLLVANILAGILIELAPRFARLVKPGGTVVLSGILHAQAAAVTAAYQGWFELRAPVERDGWARLDGVRRTPLANQH